MEIRDVGISEKKMIETLPGVTLCGSEHVQPRLESRVRCRMLEGRVSPGPAVRAKPAV